MSAAWPPEQNHRPSAGMSKTAVALLFLFIGLGVGFVCGIGATKVGASFLEGMTSKEEPAEVTHPRSYVRPGFSFKYAANWKLEAEGPDNDPDHHVNVDSPGSCLTMLFIFDVAISPEVNVKAQTDAFVPKLISAPSRTLFTGWGRYEGQGVILKGKMLGITPGSLRIFSHADDKRSFVVVEQCYDEDMAHTKPGFDLVESSFELTP